MKSCLKRFSAALAACVALLPESPAAAQQVNSGSDGSDGAFNPTQSITINMADHPTGIYQYTTVNIPSGVTVTFTPNANNTPVVWLVQGSCIINGIVKLDGANDIASGGMGGAGGYKGGNGGTALTASSGFGPGGGSVGVWGGNASFGTAGTRTLSDQALPGSVYGNAFLLPLVGGSGGGGSNYSASGGAGGGGAILIASSQSITLAGSISAAGGRANAYSTFATPPHIGDGAGSGGAIRLIASTLIGTGSISAAAGGITLSGVGSSYGYYAGDGRVRLDSMDNRFSGTINGQVTRGFQPIIIPAAGQGIQLNIASIGGSAVPASPGGVVANPDIIIAAQQVNPLPVVVNCSNIPLGTPITITVHPVGEADVTATSSNSSGTLASSTATIPVNMPRGGGIIYATATTGITGGASTGSGLNSKVPSIAQTGWTAHGEKFVAMEIKAGLGGKQSVIYLTESGKRYPVPN